MADRCAPRRKVATVVDATGGVARTDSIGLGDALPCRRWERGELAWGAGGGEAKPPNATEWELEAREGQ